MKKKTDKDSISILRGSCWFNDVRDCLVTCRLNFSQLSPQEVALMSSRRFGFRLLGKQEKTDEEKD